MFAQVYYASGSAGESAGRAAGHLLKTAYRVGFQAACAVDAALLKLLAVQPVQAGHIRVITLTRLFDQPDDQHDLASGNLSQGIST